MALDLNKLESKLDNALDKETTESLNEWIDKKRLNMNKQQRPKYFDYWLKGFKWYRKWSGGVWYKHRFTEDASAICSTWVGKTFWARYYEINRYSKVTEIETYGK